MPVARTGHDPSRTIAGLSRRLSEAEGRADALEREASRERRRTRAVLLKAQEWVEGENYTLRRAGEVLLQLLGGLE